MITDLKTRIPDATRKPGRPPKAADRGDEVPVEADYTARFVPSNISCCPGCGRASPIRGVSWQNGEAYCNCDNGCRLVYKPAVNGPNGRPPTMRVISTGRQVNM